MPDKSTLTSDAEADLQRVPASALGFEGFATAADVVRSLREAYSGVIGYELEHIASDDEREWLRNVIETRVYTRKQKSLFFRKDEQ